MKNFGEKSGAKNIDPTVGGSDSRTVVTAVTALRLGSIAANSPRKMAMRLSKDFTKDRSIH